MKAIVDLNCDMGEGYGQWTLGDAPDEEIMPLISSANIAAGFHAGDPNSMDRVVRLAQIHGVGVGAHPGYRDLQGFGRRYIRTSAEELVNDIVYQIGAIREFGRRHGVRLQHVKPHGALYMEAAANEQLSELLVHTLARTCGDSALFCMGISKTYEIARQAIPSSASSMRIATMTDPAPSSLLGRSRARSPKRSRRNACAPARRVSSGPSMARISRSSSSRSAFIRIRPGHWTWGKPSAPG